MWAQLYSNVRLRLAGTGVQRRVPRDCSSRCLPPVPRLEALPARAPRNFDVLCCSVFTLVTPVAAAMVTIRRVKSALTHLDHLSREPSAPVAHRQAVAHGRVSDPVTAPHLRTPASRHLAALLERDLVSHDMT